MVTYGGIGSLDTAFHGSVLVHSGGTLLVKPGAYRIGALTVEWGSTLKVDTTGISRNSAHPGVQLVVVGAIQWMDGFISKYPGLSDSLAATRLAVYVSGAQTVTLGNGDTLRMQLIAPQGTVLLGDQSKVWGRVQAHKVVWNNNSKGKFAANGVPPTWSTSVVVNGARRFWTNATSIPISWTVNGVTQTSQTTEALPTEGQHWIKRTSGGASDSVLALVDRTAPVVSITSPIDGLVTNTTIQPVVWTVDGVSRRDTSILVEGPNTVTRTMTDSAGNTGSATVHLTRDSHVPVVGIQAPVDGLVTNQSSQTVKWTVDGVVQTQSQIVLVEGANTITKSYTSPAGNTGSATIHVTLDSHPPAVQFLSPAEGATVSATPINVRWSVDGVEQTPFPQSLVDGTNTITKSVTDAAGNIGSAVLHVVYSTGSIPVLVAPALPSKGVPTITDRLSFLYTGPSPVQMGVITDSLAPNRLSQIFGTVLGTDSTILPGARIEILNHPEYGHTFTRNDGRWDMAINGGGTVVVSITKGGYLPVQRKASLLWNQISHIDDVFLTSISKKSLVTNVAGSSSAPQVLISDTNTDFSGSRQAIICLPSGIKASLVSASGDTTQAGSLTLRATEYTVGPNGPNAMPGPLPKASGYTYAVEISADEATAQGSTAIVFNKPVSFFLENFLNFPVGVGVPAGWYDRVNSQWIPSKNGRVIRVLSVANGNVDIDINGDGLPDIGDSTPSTEDRVFLSSHYQAGQTLWWIPLTHFTAWDFNWTLWTDNLPQPPPPDVPTPDACPTNISGCVISIENRTLGEVIPVAGEDWNLNWSSLHSRGRTIERTARIHLLGDTIPPWLRRITVSIDVAGQHYAKKFYASPNLNFDWTWDGLDAWGRNISGPSEVHITTCYLYYGRYHEPIEFADIGGEEIGVNDRVEEVSCRESIKMLYNPMGLDFGVNGWAPSQLHHLDVLTGEVLLGNGGVHRSMINNGLTLLSQLPRLATPMGLAFEPDGTFWAADLYEGGTVTSAIHYSADGKSILEIVQIPDQKANQILVEPDGNILVSSDNQIYRIHKDRSITKILSSTCGHYSNWNPESSGDGGLASSACAYVRAITEGSDGVIYIAEPGMIRRIAKNSIISTQVGTGWAGYSGDGGPAMAATLDWPSSLVVRRDGRLVIFDMWNNAIREVESDGTIKTIAGQGPYSMSGSGDGGPAIVASLLGVNGRPPSLTESPTGAICFNDGNVRVRCIDSTGIINTVAGGPRTGGTIQLPGIGTQITLPGFGEIGQIAFDPSGKINFLAGHSLIRIERTFLTGYSVISSDASEIWKFDSHGTHQQTLEALTGDTLWQFEYDSNGGLKSMRNRQGEFIQILKANNQVLITSRPSHGSQTTTLNLDQNGNVSSSIWPDGRNWRMAWNGDLLAGFTRPDSGNTIFTYDTFGRFQRDLDNTGRWQELSGGLWMGLLSVKKTTSEGVVSYYGSTSFSGGTKKFQIHPDGNETQFIQNIDGSSQTIEPDGTVTEIRFQPDARFGLYCPTMASKIVTTPAGISDTETWVTEVSDTSQFNFEFYKKSWTHNGSTWITNIQPANNQIDITSPTGRTTTRFLDSRHRVIQQSQPGILPINFTYDSLDRLTSTTQGGRTVLYTWDDSGRVASITDPMGRSQFLYHDISGRIITEKLADGRKIQMSYDNDDRVVSVIPPGRQSYGYSYDRAGLDTLFWSPKIDGNDSTAIRNRYDLDKRLVFVGLPAGDSIRVSYDAAGRQSVIASSKDTIRYTYDSVSRPSILSRAGQTIATIYDGSLPVSQTWSGVVQGVINVAWNSNFKPVSKTVSGSTVETIYDLDEVPSSIGDIRISRDSFSGLFSGYAIGNFNHQIGRNGYGEVVADTFRSGNEILALSAYERDSIGRISIIDESLNGVEAIRRYHYDLTGRLDSVFSNGLLLAWYGYDANGVRSSGTGIAGVSIDVQDRVTSTNGITYSYDQNGQMVSRSGLAGVTRYHYSIQGELQSVKTLTGDSVSYIVDPKGLRISRSVNGIVTNRWLWDGALRLTAELDSTGNILTRYVYASNVNVPDYMVRGGVSYALVTDQLGSVRMVVNTTTGEILSNMNYDPWGNLTSGSNLSFQPFGFAGGLRDDMTGLIHFGAREYSPEMGRWTAKDPIGFDGGLTNLYQYVGNDPINMTDPWGLHHYVRKAHGPIDQTTEEFMVCMDACSNRDLGITSGTDGKHSGPKDPHKAGKACDIGKGSNPDIYRDQMEQCFDQCTAILGIEATTYGQEEATHYHFQTRPGRGGAHGFAGGVH